MEIAKTLDFSSNLQRRAGAAIEQAGAFLAEEG